MGYHTIDMALFVPPDLLDQATTWLTSNYAQEVRPLPLIRNDDPDDQAARYYGIQLQVTPEMFAQIKRLSERPQFAQAKVRTGLRGTRTLRRALREEMVERGWRVRSPSD